MFKTRLLSGILLVIIALVTVITGGELLFFVLLAVSLIGMAELYKVFGIEKKPSGIAGYIAATVYYGLRVFESSLPGREAELVYDAVYGVSDLSDGNSCICLSQI